MGLMKPIDAPNPRAKAPSAVPLLTAAAERLARSLAVADTTTLKPGELIRAINGTPLGQVLTDKKLRRQREIGGAKFSDPAGKRLDLMRYVAWLANQRGKTRPAAAEKSGPGSSSPPRSRPGTDGGAAERGGPRANPADAYALKKERERARNAAASESGRDIGELPPVENPERRAKALADPEFFCQAYFPGRFRKEMSPDQRASLRDLDRVADEGGKKANAAPRGDGKTTRAEVMVIRTILKGRRKFVALIGATRAASLENLESIKGEFETNETLAADFPEVCHAIRALEGIHNRCKGQLYKGEPTRLKWSGDMLVLPTIEGSPASGSVICCRGMLGRIRGMKFRRANGETVRPDMVVVDDFQTGQSARSPQQCERRLKILTGDILGLAGPGETIACFVPCTVIEKGDAADQILDQDLHAEFQGVRTKLVKRFPTNEKLWEEYADLRRSGQRLGDLTASYGFYKKHRKAMDAGAEVAWEARFDEAGEISAIQHAMNLRIDHPETFDAEYQNEPRDQTADDDQRPTVRVIEQKISGLPRRRVHLASTKLTAFVDVQQRVLYWGVAAWSLPFTGGLIDYGTWPDQGRNFFLYRDAGRTIQQKFPTAEVTGSIRAALDALIEQLLTTEYVREDGAAHRIERMAIDSGDWSEIVYQACRESKYSGLLLPSKGLGISADKAPISEWKRAEGRTIGEEWQIGAVENKRATRLLVYDTNYWKWRLDQGLAAAASDRGCITLFGEKHGRGFDHSMIAAHVASETRQKTIAPARGRTVFVYKLPPAKPDNHLLDVWVGNLVLASVQGCRLIGNPIIPRPAKPKNRQRVTPLSC